jgi:HEAT repeat protein
MRPKFAITVLAVAGLLIAVMFYARKHVDRTASAPPVAVPAKTAVVAAPTPAPAHPAPAAPVVVLPVAPHDYKAEAIQAEVQRLYDLASTSDPAAVPTILGDLQHPEKEVRLAAITALRDCGDSSVVPSLKEAVAATDDIEEKMELLQAIDMLSAPRMEFNTAPAQLTPEQMKAREEHRARRDAQRAAQPQAKTPPTTSP